MRLKGTVMDVVKLIGLCLLLCCFVFALPLSQGKTKQHLALVNSSEAARDGQRDFDFEIGSWKTHLKISSRIGHPFTGPNTWTEYEGITVVRKVWNGRANLVELEVDGPKGHLEGLSLRLYNPQSHQWSLNFANSKVGAMSVPTVGEFKNGRGEFYDYEAIDGRMMWVRNIWSDMTPNACHFEQAFSEDGGKTWEVNWIADDTRVNEAADKAK